jgi:hypothetical protein
MRVHRWTEGQPAAVLATAPNGLTHQCKQRDAKRKMVASWVASSPPRCQSALVLGLLTMGDATRRLCCFRVVRSHS